MYVESIHDFLNYFGFVQAYEFLKAELGKLNIQLLLQPEEVWREFMVQGTSHGVISYDGLVETSLEGNPDDAIKRIEHNRQELDSMIVE